MCAVWLCFGLYFLRGRHGIPFYSVIAALQCLQPYNREMRKVARKRLIGTLIGAFWGLLALLLELELLYDGLPDELSHFLLLGLFTGAVLYSTVLLKATEASYFSAVVFLSVAINHIGDANPYLFALNRLLDTFFGIVIAELVNRLHLPRLRKKDILFVADVWDLIPASERSLSSYSRVELNRLIEDGAHFTISTEETQATVRELLPGVRLPYPVITMNGAALYDVNSMEYLKIIPMRPEEKERLIDWASSRGLSYFSNSVEDNLLVVRYRSLANKGMRLIFETKRKSPYRNFVHNVSEAGEDVLYFFLVDRDEVIFDALDDLQRKPWAEKLRIVAEQIDVPGFSGLKIYDATVSREAMLAELEARMETSRTLVFSRDEEARCDVHLARGNPNALVRELKRRFEPVDLRGWRNIFRL